jgi:spore coat protein U-like protein
MILGKLLIVLVACIVVALVSRIADLSAATVTAIFPVHATVAPSCEVSTTGLEFGVWTHQSLAANGTIGMVCGRGVEYHVSLSAGSHYGPETNLRQLAGPNPNLLLPYILYKDVGRTQEWGDRDFAGSYPQGTSVLGTGTSQPQMLTVYGVAEGSTDRLPPGSYSDTVLVTVHF